MAKRFIYVIFLLFLISSPAFSKGYDMSVPLEGESIANNTLQFEVVKEIYGITSTLNSACLDHNIIDTQVIHFPYDVVKKKNKYVKGYWKELWTVQYCSEKVQIPITFKIQKDTVIYNIDRDLILK